MWNEFVEKLGGGMQITDNNYRSHICLAFIRIQNTLFIYLF